jgi:endonuclease-3
MMMKSNLPLALAVFDSQFPDAHCELLYRQDYELLIAVVLSAQTTDQAVNQVTPKLFKAFPTLKKIATAKLSQLQRVIQTIGLFRTKAKHIQGIANMLLSLHGGTVPSDKSLLMALPGVGGKTANVVRAELFHIPEIAVDTHVTRIAKRLGLANPNDHVEVIERKLRKVLPESRYIKTHHQMIHFGRYFCTARQPKCHSCPLVNHCFEKNKNLEK